MKYRAIFVGILLFFFFAGKGGVPGNKINTGEYFFLFEFRQKLFEYGHIELIKCWKTS